MAPELCKDHPELMQTMVDFTGCMINLDCWDINASKAHSLLALHFTIATSAEGAAGGQVTSRKIDKIQESFAVSAPSDAELSSTRFGRMYVAMRKMLIVAPLVGRC